jgi:hypothetical protein
LDQFTKVRTLDSNYLWFLCNLLHGAFFRFNLGMMPTLGSTPQKCAIFQIATSTAPPPTVGCSPLFEAPSRQSARPCVPRSIAGFCVLSISSASGALDRPESAAQSIEFDAILQSANVDIQGWTLQEVFGISYDGKVVVGNGVDGNGGTQSFRAVLP